LQTLSQLNAGQLAGTTRLTLCENLTEFPMDVLALADSLEILDLSNNLLTSLPSELSQLHRLKILFASNNQFEELPSVLGMCPNLEMVGFKANKIKHVPEDSLPVKLRWLILTDNQITELPNSIGERTRLEKLALAGNQLHTLPSSMSQLEQLALIRISANRLAHCPDHILALPKLAWLAFSGNPFASTTLSIKSVPTVQSSDFTLQNVLGQGASGIISKATWNQPMQNLPNDIAVKVFKGDITSDGYPEDELQACLKVGHHPNLVQSLAQVDEVDCRALVMNLIPDTFANLGLPPSFASCSRDTFPDGFRLPIKQIEKIVAQMQDVFAHLHHHEVCHGDLYAHNTLYDADANIIFGDFGAASMYHMLNQTQKEKIKIIEQRALNHFIDDLLSICHEEDRDGVTYKVLKQQIQ
jgi:hypothetical protein